MIIKNVTVIGSTGTMGANVAGIFVSFGSAKDYCIARDIEKVKKTIPRIVKSVRADSIAANLIPADFSMLEDCVSKSETVLRLLHFQASTLRYQALASQLPARSMRR